MAIDGYLPFEHAVFLGIKTPAVMVLYVISLLSYVKECVYFVEDTCQKAVRSAN